MIHVELCTDINNLPINHGIKISYKRCQLSSTKLRRCLAVIRRRISTPFRKSISP